MFIDSGFLYAQISDTHALYSRDRAVMDALMAAEYHVTCYYSTVSEVYHSETTRKNKVSYDEKAGSLL